MASITLKDIPADLHDELKTTARRNGRSLSKEILVRLRIAQKLETRPSAEVLLRKLRRIRRDQGRPVTESDVELAIRSGRP